MPKSSKSKFFFKCEAFRHNFEVQLYHTTRPTLCRNRTHDTAAINRDVSEGTAALALGTRRPADDARQPAPIRMWGYCPKDARGTGRPQAAQRGRHVVLLQSNPRSLPRPCARRRSLVPRSERSQVEWRYPVQDVHQKSFASSPRTGKGETRPGSMSQEGPLKNELITEGKIRDD